MTRTRIAIIGRIDRAETLFDGQTVKTRTLAEMLTRTYGTQSVVEVDTRDYRSQPVRVFIHTLYAILTCRDIFVALSTNGRRVLFPVFYVAAAVFRRRIYHTLIGGWLASNLEKYPRWVKYLNSFEVNWVEAHLLCDALAEAGVNNAEFLPNFKLFSGQSGTSVTHLPSEAGDVRLVTFSRVVEGKGIPEAIEAIIDLNSREDRHFRLDIYGPIAPEFSVDFERLLSNAPSARYCGVVNPSEAVSVLKNYDALLFPTKWNLEGIPGTIIDALTAGTPIIASRWQYYGELLEDDVTGLGYPLESPELLGETILKYFTLGRDYTAVRENCLRFSRRYDPVEAFAIVKARLDSKAS